MRDEPLYRFPARLESLGAMVVHLQAIVPACESTALQRAETALEELLTNSIVHGRSARLPEPVVWLAAHGNDGALHVRFEDACAAFDPIARIDDALRRTASPMDQRPAGGLGLLMVFRLADAFRYLHENGRNRIDLTFTGRAISPPIAGVQDRGCSVDLGA
jgi:anti-sigma regulatory factor (Ser/Thr protein kinase)